MSTRNSTEKDADHRLRWSLAGTLLVSLAGCALPYDAPMPGDEADVAMTRKAIESSLHPNVVQALEEASAPQAVANFLQDGNLNLEECIDHAITANLDLQIVDARLDASEERITQAKAAFDPRISGDAIASGDGNSGIRAQKRFMTGTEFRVENGFQSNSDGRFTDNSNNVDSTAFRLRQPLLNGAGWGDNSVPIRRAYIDSTRASAEGKAELLNVLTQVELTYRGTEAAARVLESLQASLDRTKKIRDEVKTRLELGNATNLDLLEAEAAVTNARERVVRADQNYENGLDQLWFVLGLPVGERVKGMKLQPVPIDRLIVDGLDGEARYNAALTLSPTAILLANQLHQADLEHYAAKREALPRLDLELNSESLTGDSNMADKQDMSALVYFSIPLGRREGKSKIRETKSELAASVLTREQGERQLKMDILNAVRAVGATQQQLAAAHDSAEVNRKKWEEQLNRFKEGLVSVRLLMEAEDEYQSAEIKAVEAAVQLASSWLNLNRLDGSIAGLNGVKI
jgi:outer membrane protein TolC